jgi:uncharacterized OB-fold protein
MTKSEDGEYSGRPAPAITPETAFFWEAGRDGVLKFLQCQCCKRFVHPPAPYCPNCLGKKLDVMPVSGRAVVVASTVNHHQWHLGFTPPYIIAIVEIEEAPYVRLTTRIINCAPEAARIGMAVHVIFEAQGPSWLPLFEPGHS